MVKQKIIFFISLFYIINIIIPVTKAEESPVMFVRLETPERTFYIGEEIPVTTVLYSTTPDIAFYDRTSGITLSKGNMETLIRVEPNLRSFKKIIDKKTFFCYPIEQHIISFSQKGNYELVQSPFEIGVSIPVIYRDPFWGQIRTSEIKDFTVKVESCKLKIKPLPTVSSGVNFSGSIGQFTIETVVPRGKIYVNEEATAYITVKGEGIISPTAMPEYRNAFGNGLKLKSVSETRNKNIRDGELYSELILECSFVPSEIDNMVLGKVFFNFFDSKSGKYTTIESSPVPIKIESSVNKREKLSI